LSKLWAYLDDEQFDGRLILAAGYLANRIAGKVVLDLNCGYARILRYLPPTFALYVGNDLDKGALARARKQYGGESVKFPFAFDEAMRDLPGLRVDVLLAFGYQQQYNDHDSPTLDETIYHFINRDKPKIIVLEHWVDCSRKALGNLLIWCQDREYKSQQYWRVSPSFPDDRRAAREVIILERP